jgi:hypothetical protein
VIAEGKNTPGVVDVLVVPTLAGGFDMAKQPLLWSSVALLALWACGTESAGDQFTEEEGRAALVEACETQQGIGRLKREHGDDYCECWADKAQEVLGEANYSRLVQASRAELASDDVADREKIARENTELYSSVSSAAQSCGRRS